MLERVLRGQTLFVEGYGEEQVTLVDALDYRLLRAVAGYRSRSAAPFRDRERAPQGLTEVQLQTVRDKNDPQPLWNLVISAYLDGDISLGRAAQLLDINRFELSARFNRLDLPMPLGATDIDEAVEEYRALVKEGVTDLTTLVLDTTVLSNFARAGALELLALALEGQGPMTPLRHERNLISEKHLGKTSKVLPIRAARRLARHYEVEVSGTLGLLMKLVNKGHLDVDQGNQILAVMIANGYRSPVERLDQLPIW